MNNKFIIYLSKEDNTKETCEALHNLFGKLDKALLIGFIDGATFMEIYPYSLKRINISDKSEMNKLGYKNKLINNFEIYSNNDKFEYFTENEINHLNKRLKE